MLENKPAAPQERFRTMKQDILEAMTRKEEGTEPIKTTRFGTTIVGMEKPTLGGTLTETEKVLPEDKQMKRMPNILESKLSTITTMPKDEVKVPPAPESPRVRPKDGSDPYREPVE